METLTRHSGAMRSIEPGISRFQVRSFGPPRNDNTTSPQIRRRLRRKRREWPARGRRLAPGTGVAAGDHPVNDAGDDARAGHDFEMAPYDAFELKRVVMEVIETEIAGEPDEAATERIGQRAADVE